MEVNGCEFEQESQTYLRKMVQWVRLHDNGREGKEVSSREVSTFSGFYNASPHRVYLFMQRLGYLKENLSYGQVWQRYGREYVLEPMESFDVKYGGQHATT